MSEAYSVLEVEKWPRRQHYEFYLEYQQPYFGITCDLDAKKLFAHCQQQQLSFFSAYLFLTTKALNQIEPLRMRMVEGQVRVYDKIMLGCTMMAGDQTFRFCYVDHCDEFAPFCAALKAAKAAAISQPFIHADFAAQQMINNTIYMSVIPWLSFSSFNHAAHSVDKRGIPKLVFGKLRESDYSMPLAIDVHHALVDGLHVGQLVNLLQSYFDRPQQNLGK